MDIFLRDEDLFNATQSVNGDQLVLMVSVDYEKEMMSVLFADLYNMEVSFDYFEPNPMASPDFNDIEITDCGLSLRLGNYEVSNATMRKYGEIFNEPMLPDPPTGTMHQL
jgi:hypothetical protein